MYRVLYTVWKSKCCFKFFTLPGIELWGENAENLIYLLFYFKYIQSKHAGISPKSIVAVDKADTADRKLWF